MVTVDNMLVYSLPLEMLQDFVNAVDTIENGLQEGEEIGNKWQMAQDLIQN